MLVRGEVEGVESHLQAAERWLDPTTGGPPGSLARSPEMVVVDEEGFRALPASIAVHRAGQARILGDTAGTMAYAQRALDLVDEDDHLGRGAAALLGLAYWTNGDLDAADRWYTDGMASLEKAGYLSDLVGGAITQADIRIAQGRLREAMSRYERGLQIATQQAGTVLRGAADMHVGMRRVLRERNDLAAAVQHLRTSKELGEPAGLPQNRYRWRVAMAGVREAEGDLDGAVDLLNEAQRVYVSDFSPEVRPIPALRARVWIRQGRLGDAAGWVRERDLSVDEDLTYLREFEHHPRQSAPGPVPDRARRGRSSRRNETPGAPAASGGRREAERERSGDRGAAGACPPGARRHACSAGLTATRTDVGRARGLRPTLRR